MCSLPSGKKASLIHHRGFKHPFRLATSPRTRKSKVYTYHLVFVVNSLNLNTLLHAKGYVFNSSVCPHLSKWGGRVGGLGGVLK